MPAAIKIFLTLGILLLAQSVWALLDGYRFLRYVRQSRRKPREGYTPPAAVVIPCKGVDADFELNLSIYLSQDYPRYQAVFAVASERDPAYRLLQARLSQGSGPGKTGGVRTALVVAGVSESCGEKVNNLLRGLSAVEPEAEVLVFADIDARPAPDWLRSLVAPLCDPQVTVSTGFRWYLPGAGFVSQLRAAWDTSIATLLGDHNQNFAWGGSMAIRAADFRRLQVAERYWANTVSDDYALTRAVREARGKIYFEPRCLLASREESRFRDFLHWANRQIIITRVYMPHLWRRGLAAYVFYCATLLLGLALLVLPGFRPGERMLTASLLTAILLLGLGKGGVRSTVGRELFPEEADSLARYGARYWQLAPLVPWVMLISLVTAAVTRRIEWRGTRYELRSASEVRVLRRERP
jgi:ceramide glucosyltransferase